MLLSVLLVSAIAATKQVHLTTTGIPTEMAVSWTEDGDVASGRLSRVTWGLTPGMLNATTVNAPTTMTTDTENLATYDYCGGTFVTRTLHMVLLKNLPPDTDIYYRADVVNSTNAKVDFFGVSGSVPVRFHTPTLEPAPAVRFLATADMGDPVSHSWTAIPQMIKQCAYVEGESSELNFSLGIHAGDIAYNLDIPPRGDDYVNGVSPMASTFPWMMVAGNHEADCNFTYANYIGRFAAQNMTGSPHGPNSGSSRWYSFEQGPVHFIAIDTDAYGFDEVAYILAPQYNWLKADLAGIDREKTPFVVLIGHRFVPFLLPPFSPPPPPLSFSLIHRITCSLSPLSTPPSQAHVLLLHERCYLFAPWLAETAR
jgi:hypothetical protein